MRHSKGFHLSEVTNHVATLNTLRSIAPMLNSYASELSSAGLIDPLSAALCQAVFPRHKQICLVSSLHHLRYSESVLFTCTDFYTAKRVDMRQSKTGQLRVLDNGYTVSYFAGRLTGFNWLFFPSTYSALALDIYNNIPSSHRSQFHSFLDKTHIFRHAWASWRFQQSVDLNTIALELGHAGSCSVNSYVHSVSFS